MPLMMLLVGQQDQLGNEGHKKKAFTLIKLLWMSSFFASQFSAIFGRTDLKNTIKFILNNVSIRHYIFYWWNDFTGNIFFSVLQRRQFFFQFLAKYQEEHLTEFQYHLTKPRLYQLLKFALVSYHVICLIMFPKFWSVIGMEGSGRT